MKSGSLVYTSKDITLDKVQIKENIPGIVFGIHNDSGQCVAVLLDSEEGRVVSLHETDFKKSFERLENLPLEEQNLYQSMFKEILKVLPAPFKTKEWDFSAFEGVKAKHPYTKIFL